jgi:pimeloyl-ACP methyl ester carboxylesterase
MSNGTELIQGSLLLKAASLAYTLRNCDGPLIVCLHGIGSSRKIFAPIFEQKLLSHYAIITIDMMGHGESGPSMVHGYSMNAHAHAIYELLATLELSRVPTTLICHSVGGAVGLLLAQLLGEQLRGFLNLEGNLIAEDCGLITRRTITQSFDAFVRVGREQLAAEIKAQGEDNSYFLQCLPEAFYKTAESVVEWCDSGELLTIFVDELTCPREYVFGDANHSMPILSKLGQIRATSIPHSGHVMMVDNPHKFYRAIGEFLLLGAPQGK